MKKSIFLLVGLLLCQAAAWAQGERSTIRLSGYVVDGNTSQIVPGTHIYIPQAGYGTISSPQGFFSLNTVIGDTVVFSAVGFKKNKLVVPTIEDPALSILIELQEDTTLLKIVEIFPFPSPEVFKEAFLALRLPEAPEAVAMRNLNGEAMTRMAMAMPMDASANYRNFNNQRINAMSNRFFSTSYSFTNPFAWAQFIQSIKRGDLKKKGWKDED